MAKFTGFFKVVAPRPGTTTMTDSQNIGDQGVYANYTWYQRLIQGSASRITRYREYDLMDNDIEIARALDTIAEEMCGNEETTDMPITLDIRSRKDPSMGSSFAATLTAALEYWISIHDWRTRLYKLVRTTIKYGDAFFIRHKEGGKWEFVHPKNVVAAIVDERDMTRVVGWQIKREVKTPNGPYNSSAPAGSQSDQNVDVIASDRVIWFSLNDDMGESAPFGESVLRAIYRSQKQKELLEDAIIIYRIQRAPERRVFKIDVGKVAPNRTKAYLEQFKNEIRQRKVPTSGGGVDQVDSVYNPQSMTEDFFFATRPDGRGSSVEVLPGGAGLGELADLEYFQNKVSRGLRIPRSYTDNSTGGGGVTTDGKVGVAYIEELRFALFIKRLQRHVESVLDAEFKRYLRTAGISVDATLFNIRLAEPENFGEWRKQQLDNDLLTTYGVADGFTHLSKRMAMSKYLQLTDDEILMNERMKAEEMGIDPDMSKQAILKAIYGPPPEEGGDMMGGGSGPSMTAGSLGPMEDFGEVPPEEGSAEAPPEGETTPTEIPT